MNPNEILYSTLLFITTFLSLLAISLIWKRRRVSGVPALMAFLGAIALWSSTYAIFWMDLPPSREFWLNATYFGVVAVVPSFFVFVLQFTHHGNWLNRFLWTLLIALPTLTVLLLWTDPYHGLFFSGLRNFSDTSLYAGGPFFWFNVVYNYLLYLFAMVILFRQIRLAQSIYRRQLFLILMGSFIPWCTSFAAFVGLNPLPALDPTPISLSVVGLVTIYSILRYRFLEVVPIARDTLIEKMDDGVVVVDRHGFVLDVNPAAGRIVPEFSSGMVGKPFSGVFPGWPSLIKDFHNYSHIKEELVFREADNQYLDLHIIPLVTPREEHQGWLIIIRDVSTKKQAEAEREKLIHELQEALGQVKQLKGLLPICASCHKIRDDKGYWQNVEVYIREHSGAEFSHGICPECAAKLYPDAVPPTDDKQPNP